MPASKAALALAAVLFLAVSGAACGGSKGAASPDGAATTEAPDSTVEPAATPTPPLTPTPVPDPVPKVVPEFHFGATITEQQRALVVDAVHNAQVYVLAELGMETGPRLAVWVDDDPMALANGWAAWRGLTNVETINQFAAGVIAGDGSAMAGRSIILIHPRKGTEWWWDPGAASSAQRNLWQTAAHEYFHTIDLQLEEVSQTQGSGRDPRSPSWMGEGQAELVGWAAAARRAGAPPDAVAERAIRDYQFGHGTLAALEGSEFLSMQNPYSWAQDAVTYLLQQHSWAKLMAFNANLASAFDWREAWQATFGHPVEDFYATYDPYHNGRAPLISGSLVSQSGSFPASLAIVVCPPGVGGSGNNPCQSATITGSRFEVTVPPGPHILIVRVDNKPVGVYVPGGLSERQADAAIVDAGGDTVVDIVVVTDVIVKAPQPRSASLISGSLVSKSGSLPAYLQVVACPPGVSGNGNVACDIATIRDSRFEVTVKPGKYVIVVRVNSSPVGVYVPDGLETRQADGKVLDVTLGDVTDLVVTVP
ncbi:MAG: hypothetical protein HY875_10395 [Chloroflexi bacterium]|nr:hypothetical protein [Chloroflexota bacterium]